MALTFETKELSVLNGVLKAEKPLTLMYPENEADYRAMLKEAEKTRGNEEKFVVVPDLSEDEATDYRADIYAIDLKDNKRNTLRSRIRKQANGKTYLGIRYLTDAEQERKAKAAAKRQATKAANKAND